MKRTLILPALLVLSACGDSPEQSFAKAQHEFSAHDYAAARIHVAAALQERPGNRDMLLLQARALLALGDGDGAGTTLQALAGARSPVGELAELASEAALLRPQKPQPIGPGDGCRVQEIGRAHV